MIRKSAALCLLLLTACAGLASPPATPTSTLTPPPSVTASPLPTDTPLPTYAPIPPVPNFEYIAMIVFENKEFETIIGGIKSPYFNVLAQSNTLLTEHYALMHPSLPNYLAMIGGDTFGIIDNCNDCFIDSASLPDLIEASGRTWKTYQEDMPQPCFLGDSGVYVQKHNPFIYFDAIRLNPERCTRSVVPFTQLDVDITNGTLPNFMFITPNLCYSAHSCSMEMADAWLDTSLDRLVPALDSMGKPYLIIVTWDEGQSALSCCGLPEPGGGRITTILISPQAKPNFQDDTPYSHYSLLKTIAAAWGLPYLRHAGDTSTALITQPWK